MDKKKSVQFIKEAKQADINNADWAYDLSDKISDNYERGYVSAKIEELNGVLASNTEDYRDEIIQIFRDLVR